MSQNRKTRRMSATQLGGARDELQEAVLSEFWPRFIPDAKLLFAGDCHAHGWVVDQDALKELRLPFSFRRKFPGLVFWQPSKKWLILVNIVKTHGPISLTQRAQFESALQDSREKRVYLAAFPTWKVLERHVDKLAWQTGVWLAEVPDHMIHFNGPKFLAPQEEE